MPPSGRSCWSISRTAWPIRQAVGWLTPSASARRGEDSPLSDCKMSHIAVSHVRIGSFVACSGVRVVARSLKFHRPRGVWGAGPEEPNAVLDLWPGKRHDPNARATLVELAPQMRARAVNCWPGVDTDVMRALD